MMHTEITLKNAKIVTPRGIVEGSIHLCNGLIVDVHAGSTDVAGAIDLAGDCLIPGLVDLHTDNLERHMRPRKNAEWPMMPALISHDAQMCAAGITTVFDSLYVGIAGLGERSGDSLQRAVAQLAVGREARLFRGDHYLHLRAEICIEGMPEMFSSVFPEPSVLLVSVMDHSPGQRQWRDIEKFSAMEKKDFNVSQEEFDEFLKKALDAHRRISEPNRAKVLELVQGHPIALASHDDTTVAHVEQAHGEGISICEFPTTVEAAQAARARGMHIVAGSPNLVLGRSHSGNVSVEELARLGLLDALASDYVPSSMLHGAFLLHEKVGMPLHEAIATVTLAPARMVGLDDRGSIEIGKRADLVRVKTAHGLPIPLTVWREGVRL
jgi:alpha-D-ribose 1-methylphosphonate 5-triphosphate diphosphatase